MITNLKSHNVLAGGFVLGLLLACPTLAQENPPGGQPPEKTGDMQKQLDTINDNLKSLVSELSKTNKSLASAFEAVGKDMKKLQDDIRDVKDEKTQIQVQLSKALEKIKDLEDSVGLLQKEITSVQTKVTAIKLYPPGEKNGMNEVKNQLNYMETLLKELKANASYQTKSSPVTGQTGQTGRLVLVNSTGEEIVIIVNTKAYRLSPFSQQTLETHPAGVFSYEVLSPTFGVLRKNSTALNPSETFTITVG